MAKHVITTKLNQPFWLQSLRIYDLNRPGLQRLRPEEQLLLHENPTYLLLLAHGHCQVHVPGLGALLASSNLKHAAIDCADVDVQIFPVRSDRGREKGLLLKLLELGNVKPSHVIQEADIVVDGLHLCCFHHIVQNLCHL